MDARFRSARYWIERSPGKHERWRPCPHQMSFSVRKAVKTCQMFSVAPNELGKVAKLSFKARAHMLRHACGYALATKGHDTKRIVLAAPGRYPYEKPRKSSS